MDADVFTVDTVVRGYHVYRAIWDGAIGEVLPCQRQQGNVHDPYAVAVVSNGPTVVGHVPRAISYVCHLFLGRNGRIMCQVTGTRQYSRDLPQGGLEVPCKLIFYGESLLLIKVRKLLKEATESGLLTISAAGTDSRLPKDSNEQPTARARNSDVWVKFKGMFLLQTDKDDLLEGRWLSDKHVNYAQSLLRSQFSHIDGWRETLLLHKVQRKIQKGLQIVFTRGNHWILASTLSGCGIEVFDSLYTTIDKETEKVIFEAFETEDKPKLTMSKMSQQKGSNDCGVFAIAAATALAFGLVPIPLQQSLMREHLLKCFEDNAMTPFPTF